MKAKIPKRNGASAQKKMNILNPKYAIDKLLEDEYTSTEKKSRQAEKSSRNPIQQSELK